MLIARLILTLAVLLCAVACGRVEEKAAGKPETAAFVSDGAGDGSVWVVDGVSGGRLYLCGTIHILREEDYPLAPAYEAAYVNSSKLVLELPPGAATGSELTSRMSQLGVYPAGDSLESSVGKEIWAGVKNWCEKRGQDASSFNRFRPWFASLVITSTEFKALDAKPDHGVDSHFEDRAQQDGKPAEGLETVEFQIQLFASLNDKQQREVLQQTLGEISSLAEEFEKMISAWRHGDLAALHEMLFREAEKHPDLMNLFLNARNLAWMDKLEAMMDKGEKVMVLVGTGHFTGEKGLVELMRERGHRVRHYREVTDF